MLLWIADGKCVKTSVDRTLLFSEYVDDRDKLDAKDRYDRPLPEGTGLSVRKFAKGVGSVGSLAIPFAVLGRLFEDNS